MESEEAETAARRISGKWTQNATAIGYWLQKRLLSRHHQHLRCHFTMSPAASSWCMCSNNHRTLALVDSFKGQVVLSRSKRRPHRRSLASNFASRYGRKLHAFSLLAFLTCTSKFDGTFSVADIAPNSPAAFAEIKASVFGSAAWQISPSTLDRSKCSLGWGCFGSSGG